MRNPTAIYGLKQSYEMMLTYIAMSGFVARQPIWSSSVFLFPTQEDHMRSAPGDAETVVKSLFWSPNAPHGNSDRSYENRQKFCRLQKRLPTLPCPKVRFVRSSLLRTVLSIYRNSFPLIRKQTRMESSTTYVQNFNGWAFTKQSSLLK